MQEEELSGNRWITNSQLLEMEGRAEGSAAESAETNNINNINNNNNNNNEAAEANPNGAEEGEFTS